MPGNQLSSARGTEVSTKAGTHPVWSTVLVLAAIALGPGACPPGCRLITRDAAHVPQLHHDAPAWACTASVTTRQGGHLRVAPQAGHVGIACACGLMAVASVMMSPALARCWGSWPSAHDQRAGCAVA